MAKGKARILPRAFYTADGLSAASALLGKILLSQTVEGTTSGRIVEVEAYLGSGDRAAHAFRGRTPRTEILWAEGGRAYVYSLHTHHLFNVTLGPPEVQDVVLVRALEPLDGLPLMRQRRGERHPDRLLCAGPGRLCQALGITRSLYGHDLTQGTPLCLMDDGTRFAPAQITASPRIGIDYAGPDRDLPWRLHLANSPFVSRRRG